MSDTQNRIDRAQAALETYIEQDGIERDEPGTNVADLIADLLHLIQAEHEDDPRITDPPAAILSRAEINFEAERGEQ